MGISNKKVLVRGAGDIASGIIWSLAYAGFKVVASEVEKPSSIRTSVSFSDAIFDGTKIIDGLKAVYAKSIKEVIDIIECDNVAIYVDRNADILKDIKFDIVVDAIMAKKNVGTKIDMAEVVIGVGPGFTAKVDCHYAVETMRGHKLSYIYEDGSPLPDTGIPGLIATHGADRVLHSPCDGIFKNVHKIGDVVSNGTVLSRIEEEVNGKATGNIVELCASIDGVLRGILKDGFYAKKGLKAADIDPRIEERENAFTISDKSRAVGNAVVCAIIHELNKKDIV